MDNKILTFLLEVTSDELNNAFSKQFKNSFGNKFNRSLDRVTSTQFGNQVAMLKSENNLKQVGALTLPFGSKTDFNVIHNASKNITPGYNNMTNQQQIDYINNTYPKYRGIYNDSTQSIKAIDQSNQNRNNAQTLKGINALTNNHEQNEFNLFKKKNMPQTNDARFYGHHSFSNILGRERNNIVTGDDGLKSAGNILNNGLRTGSGEISKFLQLIPKNKDGRSVINSPDEYQNGPRLNRSFLRNMYYKELGIRPKNRLDALNKIKSMGQK